MTFFVKTTGGLSSAGCILHITGQKVGTSCGKTIEEACMYLVRHITKDDTAYVDLGGAGTATADMLSKYCNVVRVFPTKDNVINEGPLKPEPMIARGKAWVQ